MYSYFYLKAILKNNVQNYWIFVLFFTCSQLFAQERNQQINQELQKYVAKEGILASDATDYVITSQHTSKKSGIQHLYFNQAINGIKINGTESAIHIKDGKTITFHQNFIKQANSKVNGSNQPNITAPQAILAIAQQMHYQQNSSISILNKKSENNQKATYLSKEISSYEIPTQLVYQKTNSGLVLAWEIAIAEVQTSNWWNFQVNASTGTILDKHNWTVSCGVEHQNHEHIGPSYYKEDKTISNENEEILIGAYNVYAMPLESPGHGGRTNVSNPDDPTSSPYGWHDTNGVAGAEYTYTKGNNTDAYDDDNNSNSGTIAKHADGGGSLNFNFPINTNYSSGNQSEDAAVTNLFYWSNIVHDVIYHYGFDEASGNFQENNYGNGGTGGDSVNSEAQDGGGTCNANFATPTEGINPRMQMYICGSRDGDLDNGVIVHEYGHGISTRLTGGANNSSCLNNQEQMGEGWSDYFALIFTIEPGDTGADSRGIGTWLIGEGPNGPGIRTQPYSTTTNTYTYDSIKTEVAPHGVGSVWAMMLWEMTWDLIAVHGFDPDMYNGTGGNNIALALVVEALKLQPCSPGFIDGRDAILAADQALYGGQNQCIIWQAFARRGLGYSALQGSTNNKSDGTEAFDLPPGTASFDTPLNQLCQTQGIQNGLGGGIPINGVYSGLGVTDDGNGTTYSFDPNVSGTGTITITYTVNDACSGGTVNLTDTINVTDGIPTLVCKDATINLDVNGNATISEADVVDNLQPGSGYTIDQTGTFAPIDISTGATNLNLTDDDSATVAMFSFPFFGNNFSTIYVSSNGYLSFTNSGLTEWQNDTLPDPNNPQNVIATVWDDLNPSDGGTIRYKMVGTAPNRIMVIEYVNVPHYQNGGGSTNTVTSQIQLYEGSGRIEIHTTNADSDGGTRTQGIENSNGDTAFVTPGRNATDWNVINDFVSFIPNTNGLADNCGNPVTISLSNSNFTCEDIGSNTVIVTADDGNGGIATCNATVTVVGATSTFAAGSWDVVPNAGSKALFQDNYNTTNNGNVTACSCEIEAGNTVTVNAGGFLDITGNILVNGTLDVQHEGSVVQSNDLATVTNNGTIFVRKTTPTLDAPGFMILGNPMTSETREGVYNSAARVLHHITGNFVPNGAVGSGTENFADDNNNNWALHSGALTAAEGYLVKPFFSGSPSSTYSMDYTQGTLNNGVITYNLLYNGTRESSANMLGNPYASAIDNDAFLAANPLLDAIYYWQHITAPVQNFPGFNQLNYNLGDLSAYNQGSGGVAAANGGGIPTQFMASGQGFAVKALGAGPVTFNNSMRVTGPNTDYRNSENIPNSYRDRQRIWLDLKNETYGLYSNMLIAFTQNATNGFENKYDTKRFDTPISLYTVLEEGEELAIQGRTAFNIDQEVALGFNTQIQEAQNYSISINQLEGVDIENTDVYLEDRLLHVITNLSEKDYTFTANAGKQNNRFVLIFVERVLGNDEITIKNITILPNPTSGKLNIYSPNVVMDKIEIIDLQGRVIYSEIIETTNIEINLNNLDAAMYFIKINTSKGNLMKQIIKK
ncbi:MAG: M36 family metallopeptidase [Flavobacteriales bacterium]